MLYASNSRKAREVLYAGKTARTQVGRYYGDAHKNDTNNDADAYRHTLWNIFSTVMVGSEFTTYYTMAHEYGWLSNLDIEYIQGTYMDLYNNGIGRMLGLGASDAAAIAEAKNAVHSGQLLRIVNGQLVKTD